jgi:transcriptional regulator with XRE-family HTH domain
MTIAVDTMCMADDVSSDDLEARLGSQIRTLRLEAGLDQQTLADLADVGLSSLKNLENGRGSTLRTLVRVLRALAVADWLETLAPEPTISPLDVLRGQAKGSRQRVYRPRADRPPADSVSERRSNHPSDLDDSTQEAT